MEAIISHGRAKGVIKFYKNDNVNSANNAMVAHKSKEREIERFNKARKKTLAELNDLMEKNPLMREYLLFTSLAVDDDYFVNDIATLIINGISTPEAIRIAVDKYSVNLRNSPSTYLRERVADLDDLKLRLISNLEDKEENKSDDKYIIFSDELYPSTLIAYKDNIIGIISREGGMTSHTAIIARSLKIPYILTEKEFVDGQMVLIDTRNKVLTTNIDIINKYQFIEETEEKLVAHDGYKFYLNASNIGDAQSASRLGFDGIGLFRTEMSYIDSGRPLSLPEHYEIYSNVKRLFPDTIFRTFDIANDKYVDYLNLNDNTLANYMRNHVVFKNQIKAILACDRSDRAKIMFPLIRKPSEFDYLKNWVNEIASRLAVNPPYIGMMLETKDAFEHLEEFKPDFISIGTNDLVRELYGISRENLTELSSDIIKDLANKIGYINDYCNKNNIALEVCGELASSYSGAKALLNIGIKTLSINASSIKNLNKAYLEFVNKK